MRTAAAVVAVPGSQPTGIVADLLLGGGSRLLPCDIRQILSLFGEGGEYGVFLRQLDSLESATTLEGLARGAEQCAQTGNSVAGALGRLLIAPSIRGALGGISAAMTRNDSEKAAKLMVDLCDQVGDTDAACMLFQLDGQFQTRVTQQGQFLEVQERFRGIIAQRTSASAMRIDPSRANEFTQEELPRQLADPKLHVVRQRRAQLLKELGRSLAGLVETAAKSFEMNLPDGHRYLIDEVETQDYEFLRIPERVSP